MHSLLADFSSASVDRSGTSAWSTTTVSKPSSLLSLRPVARRSQHGWRQRGSVQPPCSAIRLPTAQPTAGWQLMPPRFTNSWCSSGAGCCSCAATWLCTSPMLWRLQTPQPCRRPMPPWLLPLLLPRCRWKACAQSSPWLSICWRSRAVTVHCSSWRRCRPALPLPWQPTSPGFQLSWWCHRSNSHQLLLLPLRRQRLQYQQTKRQWKGQQLRSSRCSCLQLERSLHPSALQLQHRLCSAPRSPTWRVTLRR